MNDIAFTTTLGSIMAIKRRQVRSVCLIQVPEGTTSPVETVSTNNYKGILNSSRDREMHETPNKRAWPLLYSVQLE